MAIRDGDWELYNYDMVTGKSTWRLFDGQATHFRTDYPVDNIIKSNEQAKSEMRGQKWGGGKRIASIPLNVYFDKLHEAQLQDDDKYVSKWLNDSDNAKFRTFEGTV